MKLKYNTVPTGGDRRRPAVRIQSRDYVAISSTVTLFHIRDVSIIPQIIIEEISPPLFTRALSSSYFLWRRNRQA